MSKSTRVVPPPAYPSPVASCDHTIKVLCAILEGRVAESPGPVNGHIKQVANERSLFLEEDGE